MKLSSKSAIKLSLAAIVLGAMLPSTSFARTHRSDKAYHSYRGEQTYVNRDSHYPTIDDFPVAGN